MGNPIHFSLEVPQRAHSLLRDLYDTLGETEGTKLPLKATFLLSISMPIVILPIERILKRKAHMNDVNQHLADGVANAIDDNTLARAAPFFAGRWEYASLEKGAGFPNLARHGLPNEIAEKLDKPEAVEKAKDLSSKRFCDILRNALAHGGVLYLDEHGRSTVGDPVQRFAFVSTNSPYNPTELFFLRTTMGDYRVFLQRWIDWLKENSVEQVLADDLGVEPLGVEAQIVTDHAPAPAEV